MDRCLIGSVLCASVLKPVHKFRGESWNWQQKRHPQVLLAPVCLYITGSLHAPFPAKWSVESELGENRDYAWSCKGCRALPSISQHSTSLSVVLLFSQEINRIRVGENQTRNLSRRCLVPASTTRIMAGPSLVHLFSKSVAWDCIGRKT